MKMIKYCAKDFICGYRTYGETTPGCCYPGYCDYQVPRDSRLIKISQDHNTREQEKENRKGEEEYKNFIAEGDISYPTKRMYGIGSIYKINGKGVRNLWEWTFYLKNKKKI